MPTDRYPQDERLERLEDYLLGLLPEAEAERLDELSITDETFAWRLRAAEDDLVDAYARGDMPATTRARFEEHYLSSPRHRERVEFARSLARTTGRAADRGDHVAAVNASSTHDAHRPAARTSGAWWLLAAAAAVVVAFGALLVRTGLLRSDSSVPPGTVAGGDWARGSGGSPPTAKTPADSQSVATAPVANGQPPSGSAATAEPIVLSADTRAAGSITAVTIPLDADHVEFDLRLEANDFPRYQATLKDPGTDRAVWQSGWIAPVVKRESPVVPIAVPARSLRIQHYTFELIGRTDTNRTDLVASYVFEVVPR